MLPCGAAYYQFLAAETIERRNHGPNTRISNNASWREAK
jgi:hypothetical protein